MEVLETPLARGTGPQAALGTVKMSMTAGEWCRKRSRNNTRSTLEELNQPLVVNVAGRNYSLEHETSSCRLTDPVSIPFSQDSLSLLHGLYHGVR